MTIELELPEVETIRYALAREVAGRKVKTAEAESMAVLGRYRNRQQFTSALEGRKFGAVRRIGLLLITGLDGEDLLVIRPGAGATLRRHAARDARGEGQLLNTRVVGGNIVSAVRSAQEQPVTGQ